MTQVPDAFAGTNFDFFSSVALAGSSVAFTGGFLSGGDVVPGVYVKTPSDPIKVIADTSTPVPGSSFNFNNFGNVSIDPSNVAFEGFSSSGSVKGIYTNFGGTLAKVIATGDVIGGKTVTGVNMGPAGFSGDQIVFEAAYSDGSLAISAATIGGGNRCPLSQGFWKNHPAQWPETTLTLGNQTYSQSELVSIMSSSTSDASIQLAVQLIAAELNIFNGSNPAPAAAAIADGNHQLEGFAGKLPYNVKPSSAVGKAVIADANTLIDYNAGRLTPGCTP